MKSLPEDIVTDILSRLQVKHLLHCKCVSYGWYDLIRDPYFIKHHRECSQKRGSKHRIVYRSTSFSLRSADFDSFDGEAIIDHSFLNVQIGSPGVVGSCDGLLCLCDLSSYVYSRFALYNPATRSFNLLPLPPFELPVELQYMLYLGFGYDSINDDYKVLRIAQTSEDNSDFFRCDARVYSLKTKAWRKISDVPYCLYRLHRVGILLNGALHFLASGVPEQNVPDTIVSFNLADESYYTVPQPAPVEWPPEPEEKRRWLTIGVLDGCLSQLYNRVDDHHHEVWIMKEYGVQNSWGKLFRIAYPEPIPFFFFGDGERVPVYLRPISFSRNRKELFFMKGFGELVSYDLEQKTLRTFVHPLGSEVTFDVHLYEETLTPPCGSVDEGMMVLPEDVIIDILSRLPVKSLLQFKCVSYSWYDMISDFHFIYLHLERSRKRSSTLHVVYSTSSSSLRIAEFDSFDGDSSLDHHPLNDEHKSAVVAGSSDGLLCLCDLSNYYCTYQFALYNPTTRSSNILPLLPFDVDVIQYDLYFGFGYDNANDDYKVVRIAQSPKNPLRCDARVYSLNTNSWKKVADLPYRLCGSSFSGNVVNGVVHWVASLNPDKENTDTVVGFDISCETYCLIPQPASLAPLPEDEADRCFLEVGVLDGCLSLLYNYWDDHVHDVWVMKEYGVKESWSRLFRIVDEDPSPITLRPLSFSRDKKVLFLMLLHRFLVTYDPEEKTLKKFVQPNGSTIMWDAHIYEETLVPTDAGSSD